MTRLLIVAVVGLTCVSCGDSGIGTDAAVDGDAAVPADGTAGIDGAADTDGTTGNDPVIFVDCDFNAPPSSEAQEGFYSCTPGTATLFFGSNQNGPVFDHTPDEGWMNSGAAKFYTHVTGNNTYRVLHFNQYSAPSQQNLRYVLKVEPGGSRELDGKWHLAEGATWRTWTSPVDRTSPLDGVQPEIAFHNTESIAHGNGASEAMCLSEGYQCCQHPNTWVSATLTSCTRHENDVFYYADYEGEWVAIEIERRSDGRYKQYVWTRDGMFNGGYYEVDTTFNEDLAAAPMGAYFESTGTTGKYFIVDELVVADGFIGSRRVLRIPGLSAVSTRDHRGPEGVLTADALTSMDNATGVAVVQVPCDLFCGLGRDRAIQKSKQRTFIETSHPTQRRPSES